MLALVTLAMCVSAPRELAEERVRHDSAAWIVGAKTPPMDVYEVCLELFSEAVAAAAAADQGMAEMQRAQLTLLREAQRRDAVLLTRLRARCRANLYFMVERHNADGGGADSGGDTIGDLRLMGACIRGSNASAIDKDRSAEFVDRGAARAQALGARLFTQLTEASNPARLYMYTRGDSPSAADDEQPEEGDLIVLARFAPRVWVVETVEHASAVELLSLDGQPHDLQLQAALLQGAPAGSKAASAGGSSGYWLPYDGTEEALRRAEGARNEEATLLDHVTPTATGGGSG